MTARCLTLQRIESEFALRSRLSTLVACIDDRHCVSPLHLRVFLHSYLILA